MNASGFGLFDPALEKDSCGVGFIADIKGRKSHKIVEDALTILVNLEHRGAVGADPRAGDGAGILVQIPHKFFAKQTAALGFSLPAPGQYAVGILFLPHEAAWRQEIMDTHIRIGNKYPSVKLNTTYSFGLDDQDFVVAFETEEPKDFLDLVMELRETESSLYTERDTPIFTCIQMSMEKILGQLF